MINSKQKGKTGELEFCHECKKYGWDNVRRGQQFCGANGDADVVGLPGIHCEVKRVQALNIYKAMGQAKNDARPGERPTVFHRKNHCEWLVTMRLEDWFDIFNNSDLGGEK